MAARVELLQHEPNLLPRRMAFGKLHLVRLDEGEACRLRDGFVCLRRNVAVGL